MFWYLGTSYYVFYFHYNIFCSLLLTWFKDCVGVFIIIILVLGCLLLVLYPLLFSFSHLYFTNPTCCLRFLMFGFLLYLIPSLIASSKSVIVYGGISFLFVQFFLSMRGYSIFFYLPNLPSYLAILFLFYCIQQIIFHSFFFFSFLSFSLDFLFVFFRTLFPLFYPPSSTLVIFLFRFLFSFFS
uniref:Uncharacterized protein n=1 Tax=Cacopsylla melanoneura TaxID=428564 RepID=A0A8D8VQX4_9HEMI